MDNPHETPTKEKWIKLSPKDVKHIFIYYCIVFSISLMVFGITVCQFVSDFAGNIGLLLIFSFVCGLLGGTFYYIRKLYKSCIQLLVDTEKNVYSADAIVTLGAKVYFYFRPIMAATLAVLIILGIYGGFFFLQDQPTINTEKFYIFTALAAFIIGYSNGNIIIQLDRNKDKVAEMIKFGKEDK